MVSLNKITLEVSILAIALLAIFIRWFIVFDKEASAPPIIIDDTTPENFQLDNLIKKTRSNLDPVTNNAGFIILNYDSTGRLGKTGYDTAGLGQPCTTEENFNVQPNLPGNFERPPCDATKDLACITGIYKGSICLTTVNGGCNLSSDCSPEASFCINNLCQEKGEVINKVCSTDLDCKGVLGNLNHVCDKTSKRCVYNTWPTDSGCTNKTQCVFNDEHPTFVDCLKSGENNLPVLSITGTFDGEKLIVTPEKRFSMEILKGTYAYVVGIGEVSDFEARLLITEVTDSSLSFFSTNGMFSDKHYTVQFGTKKDGICVIKYPRGTAPTFIPGTYDDYPCASGNKIKGYCVEEGRTEPGGSINQICLYNGPLTCQEGLSCTFDPDIYNLYNTGIESTYLSGTSINGQEINNIGICKDQIRKRQEPCEDNCLKQYICLNETDINGDSFNYCNYEWDIFSNRSDLNGCPLEGEVFEEIKDDKCKYKNDNFCFNDNECSSGKCNGDYHLTFYDGSENRYIPMSGIYGGDKEINLLMSKGVCGVSTPSLIGYYFNTGTCWEVWCNLDGENSYHKYVTVEFEDELVKDPVFSVFQKKDSYDHQLNIEYILKYKNNRKRVYTGKNFYFSGLADGTSVFFEGDPGIYNIDYGNITINGLNLSLDKVLKDGVSVRVPDGFMTTYDCRYSIVAYTTFLAFDMKFGTGLNHRDNIEYIKKDGSGLSWRAGYVFKPVQQNSYYNYVFPIEDASENGPDSITKLINLTETYNSTNYSPRADGQYTSVLYTVSNGTGIPFKADNSYLKLKEMHGFNFHPIVLNKKNQHVLIKKRKDYVTNQNGDGVIFNFPIGYFSDTTDITSEITDNSVLLTYKYGDNVVNSIGLSYQIGGNLENVNVIETSSGTCFITYNIENSFQNPAIQVPSSTSFSVESAPYEIDEARYFNETPDKNTINFLSTYKELYPSSSRTQIGNIGKMRNVKFNFNHNGVDGEVSLINEGLENTEASFLGFDSAPDNLPFGNTVFYNLHPIVSSLTSTNNDDNIFLGSTNIMIFKNQDDIDVILKYGAADLVVSFTNEEKTLGAVAITNISIYDVDDEGKQTLEVNLSNRLHFSEKLNNPKLYYNNIFPMQVKTGKTGTPPGKEPIPVSTLTDGRVIFSSCVPEEEAGVIKIVKTSYNKIFAKVPGIDSYSFYDFYIFKYVNQQVSAFGGPPRRNGSYIRSFLGAPQIIPSFQNLDFEMDFVHLTQNGLANLPSPTAINTNIVYFTNDNFLSTLMLTNQVYLNDIRTSSTFSVIGKYGEKTKPVGEINGKIITKPFYTGKIEGLLDETYLSKIMWPYWIDNLNVPNLYVDKMFLNWNPGNMENDMFYYAFVELNGSKLLLYLSTNFTKADIIGSQSVPIILDQGEILHKNLFMQPYTKQLSILSKTCVTN